MGASQVEESQAQSQKLYTCEHCQMTFLRPVHLERHMRNVHSQEQESECKVCHKLFQNKYYLSVHMLTHAMDKELECPLCKKRFQDVEALNKHKDAHLGIGVNNDNVSFMQGTNVQLNNQISAANVTGSSASTTSAYSGTNRGNTLNCDLRLTDLNSLNRNTRNYRLGRSSGLSIVSVPSSKNSTVNCDLRLGDINSLNQNTTSSIRLPQKRPNTDDKDVIVTGVSSLKRPFRLQVASGSNTSRNQASLYNSPLVTTANKTPVSSLSQLSSRNNYIQNQLRTQNSLATQQSINNSMNSRNVTDRIYLTSEGVSSQSTVRNSLPARISYSNRKQLANHLTQNNRFGNSSIYSNLSNQRNQILRNSNQAGQRSIVNCDLTRSNLSTITRRTGLPYKNTNQQSSNGTNESDSTVNCDLTISNISSLNKNHWPTNSNNNSSRAAQLRNYGLSTRPVSTVNFDLTTADINVLKRNRRLRQAGRVLGPGQSTVGQSQSTLNCDLSVVNLASIEKNRHVLNNGNRFGRLNPNVITSQNSQLAQNTVNCDLTTNNLNDWNRRNTICYRANNQATLGQNRLSARSLNSHPSHANQTNLNQQVANALRGQSTQQHVRPVQVYANTAILQRHRNAAALNNSNFGVQGSNNVLRTRTFPRRTGVGPSVSSMNSYNRSRMSRMIRQRKTLAAPNNVPVIDLDPDDDVSIVSKSSTLPSSSTNVVQFDLTGPNMNVTTYENGSNSFSNKKPSVNLVDIVELDTRSNTMSQPVSSNAASVVEFDLSNTSIQAFSTSQNKPSSTCTINLDSDDWANNSRTITTENNTSSDITLLEVRSVNKAAKEPSQGVSDITLSNVRSLSNMQSSNPEDERTAVSGITLVDIRSLSTSEINANFQNAEKGSEKSLANVSSEKSQNISDNSSVRSSSLAPVNSRSTSDLLKSTLDLDNVVTVDLCAIDVDNTEAKVVTESDCASENQARDKGELKEDYFTCKICLEQIHHLCNYISHLKSHNSKEFCKCYYCDTDFGNIQELVVHSVVHVGDLKNQCVFCREVLASGEDPITHMTGCGEFQCIMFESGTRVKIEKTYQKDEESENVSQDQVNQDSKLTMVTKNKVNEDGESLSAAQMLEDQNEESKSQDEKTENKAQKKANLNEKEENEAQNKTDHEEEAKAPNLVTENEIVTHINQIENRTKNLDDQNQTDQDENAETVVQSLDDQNESMAQNQTDQNENGKNRDQDPITQDESGAQNQTDQDDEVKSGAQNFDQDGNKAENQTDQNDVKIKGKNESTAQNQTDRNDETKSGAGNFDQDDNMAENTTVQDESAKSRVKNLDKDVDGEAIMTQIKVSENIQENNISIETEKNKGNNENLEKDVDKTAMEDRISDVNEVKNMEKKEIDTVQKIKTIDEDECQKMSESPNLEQSKILNEKCKILEEEILAETPERSSKRINKESETDDISTEMTKNTELCSEAENTDSCSEKVEKKVNFPDKCSKGDKKPDISSEAEADTLSNEDSKKSNFSSEEAKKSSSLEKVEKFDLSSEVNLENSDPCFEEVEMVDEEKHITQTSGFSTEEFKISNQDKNKEMHKINEDKMEVFECNVSDQQLVDGLEAKNSKIESEEKEDNTKDKIEMNIEEMETENTEKCGNILCDPMQDTNLTKTDMESCALTEKVNDNALDSREFDQKDVKMEENKNDDGSTSWCKWEKELLIKSEFKDSIATKVNSKIEADVEIECQKEIEFEVNVNMIKTEINDFKETMEENEQPT